MSSILLLLKCWKMTYWLHTVGGSWLCDVWCVFQRSSHQSDAALSDGEDQEVKVRQLCTSFDTGNYPSVCHQTHYDITK
jgi:hypothetical protein